MYSKQAHRNCVTLKDNIQNKNSLDKHNIKINMTEERLLKQS